MSELSPIEHDFLRYTEMQLVTLETLAMRKNVPRSDLERHIRTAGGMITRCIIYRLRTPEGQFSRVSRFLEHFQDSALDERGIGLRVRVAVQTWVAQIVGARSKGRRFRTIVPLREEIEP